MPTHWNISWLNQNAQRSYPLTEAATKQDQTGTFTLPDSFLVELFLPVHAGLDVTPERFFIKAVSVFASGYSVEVAYDDDSADPATIAAANIAAASHVENRNYALAGAGDFYDSVGRLSLGDLGVIGNIAPGRYVFDPEGSALEPDAIWPMIRGISSITAVSASGERSEPLVGHIELVARENMRITTATVTGRDPEIRFSAISGEGLNEECVCEEGDGEGVCIQTINGIPPLPNGNFRLVGDDCIEIEAISNGLSLSDRCSKPCCGCEELQPLITQIDRFADGVVTLRNFIDNLGAETTQFHTVVLGSRLGDQGCVS